MLATDYQRLQERIDIFKCEGNKPINRLVQKMGCGVLIRDVFIHNWGPHVETQCIASLRTPHPA